MIAEQHALVARAEGILGRSLIEAPPGESQEELDRIAEEDRSLAREGLVELMDEEGETYHKHIDELEPWDVADRVRAQTARIAWLASRTQQRIERQEARRLSGLDGARRRTPRLSRRQLEILKGAARGLPNRLIAERVNLAESTVKRHLANIYERIGVSSRSAAVAKGVAEGWLALEDMSPDRARSAGGEIQVRGGRMHSRGARGQGLAGGSLSGTPDLPRPRNGARRQPGPKERRR